MTSAAVESPFVSSPRQQLSQVAGFAAAHVRELGGARGVVAFGATLARFVRLRVKIGRSDAPMVDDAVAFSVAMYRTLSGPVGADRALEVVQGEVVAAGTKMMSGWIPTDRTMLSLGRQVRTIMGDAEQRSIYGIDAMATSSAAISWDVTSCRYAELTKRLGSPEVGAVFCAVDGPFVAEALPDINFSVATTIAGGGDRCRFRVGDAVPVELRGR